MNQYIYLLLCIYLFFIWLIIFLLRKELKNKLLKLSLWGGVAGLLAEIWYFRDYWQPPIILEKSIISIEDFLFGFFIGGIGSMIYDLILKKNIIKDNALKKEKNLFLIFFITGVVSLLFFNNFLRVNSIIVSSLAFLSFSLMISFIRKDLFSVAIISGFLLVLIIIPFYLIIPFLSAEFWQNYWLLYGTDLGLMIFSIPLTEILWYFSLGSLAGVAFEFVSGSKKVNFKYE